MVHRTVVLVAWLSHDDRAGMGTSMAMVGVNALNVDVGQVQWQILFVGREETRSSMDDANEQGVVDGGIWLLPSLLVGVKVASKLVFTLTTIWWCSFLFSA